MHFVLLCKCTQRGKGDLAPEVCSVVIAVLVSATLLPATTLIEQVQLHSGFTEPVYTRKCVLVLWGIVGACTCACHVLVMCLSCACHVLVMCLSCAEV